MDELRHRRDQHELALDRRLGPGRRDERDEGAERGRRERQAESRHGLLLWFSRFFATSGRSVIRTPIPWSMSIRITSGSFTVQAPSTTPAFRASATASGVTSE